MSIFAGRPELLLLFIAQTLFIILQILILVRLSRGETILSSTREERTSKETRSRSKKKKSRR